MNLKELRERCLALPGTEASYPFGPGALVMKVGEKMYAVVAEGAQPLRVTLSASLRSPFGSGLHIRPSSPAITQTNDIGTP